MKVKAAVGCVVAVVLRIDTKYQVLPLRVQSVSRVWL